METGTVYKVRNKKNGLLSTGSRNGLMGFTKNGKSYNSIGNVKSMLKQFTSKYGCHLPSGVTFDDLELVSYEIKELYKKDINELIK